MSIRTIAIAAVLALCATTTRAGSLTIDISEGRTFYKILDQGPLDTQGAANMIQALTTALVFPDFTVVSLNASTNNPGSGDPTGASLIVGGEIQRTTGGDPATLVINAYQTNFHLPAGPPLTLSSTAGTPSYSDIPAGATGATPTQVFGSFYNNASPLPPVTPGGFPAPPIVVLLSGTGSVGDTTTSRDGLPGTPGPGPDFSLTNQFVLTVGGATSQDLTPDITFSGRTGIHLSAVPEPAGVLLLGVGVSLGVLWLRRIRRVP
jgi:hypothetical protein